MSTVVARPRVVIIASSALFLVFCALIVLFCRQQEDRRQREQLELRVAEQQRLLQGFTCTFKEEATCLLETARGIGQDVDRVHETQNRLIETCRLIRELDFLPHLARLFEESVLEAVTQDEASEPIPPPYDQNSLDTFRRSEPLTARRTNAGATDGEQDQIASEQN